MTDITPPPELAAQWVAEIYGDPAIPLHPITLRLVERAAQWGYLQHEKALLDAMHAAELPPSSVDEHGYPLELGDFYAS